MATVQLNAVAYGFVDQEHPDTHYSVTPSNWYEIGSYGVNYKEKCLLLQFESFPSNLKRNELLGIQAVTRLRGIESYSSDYLSLRGFDEVFDPETVTWNTKPTSTPDPYMQYSIGKYINGNISVGDYTFPTTAEDQRLAKLIANGGSLRARFAGDRNQSGLEIRPLLSNNANTYVIITYDPNRIAISNIIYKSGPKSGYYNPKTAATFSWEYQKTAATRNLIVADDTFVQASATFYWKKSTDENYTAIQISGTAKNVTVPANTFPTASTIQWFVRGTDTDGTTSQTEVFSFSTAAGTAYAYAQAPIGSVEDGSAPIVFRWNLGSSDGQTPSRVRAWWKLPTEDDNSWHTLCDVHSAITSYTAAAGTFQAGEVQWKVQAFNIDGTAGPWDADTPNAKTFVVVAAPNPVAGLSATAVPLTTISWQSGEQKAYEISIDGNVVRKAYSETVNTWKVPEPLPDGNHEISVRVQGQYGLWSQPSAVTITVSNTTSRTLTLQGTFDLDAELAAVMSGSHTFTSIHWYRDGVQFAQQNRSTATSVMSFTDRTVLGRHSYYAEVWFSNGNYVRSNTVSGTMTASRLTIAPAAGGDWLDLGLSDQRENRETFNMKTSPALYHVLGAKYPHADLSPFVDYSGSYNCAFTDPDKAAQFEAMFGTAVILKSRWNNVLTGILTPLRKTANRFYVAYTFTVQQINTEKLVIVNENT